jgi:hypothetical protein
MENAGAIPKDKYNHVWTPTFLYDYLHLDREARDLDFKQQPDLKQKLSLALKN